MQRTIPRSTLLRFPLIFIGFLGIIGTGLIYRESWMGNVEDQRNELFKENMEGKKLIQDFIAQHGKHAK